MSDVIKLLPDSVANQIAAGEVIQRPASVIKELVENAIDASATSIEIVLKDAGRTLIQIIDNGVGMSDTDARLAFERHSTSKIRCADDLFSLHTMGFRGEALASIAAIAQVELRTRRADDQLGTRLLINASHCELQEPCSCPVGSNFMIKNLFFNVPARRKFLKSNQVELSNIIKEFEKLALVNNGVEFKLSHNGSMMYHLQPGSFLQRIVALMGRSIEGQLIPVSIDTELVRVHGFVGKPENSRRRNAIQFMFANERFMRHPYFHKAIMSCYDQLIPEGEQPNYFLRFNVDPHTIDVNIHPTKTEIKFEDEVPIWQILSAGVREVLGRFSNVPLIDFDTEGAPEIPAYGTGAENPVPPTIDLDPSYNPFASNRNNGGEGTTPPRQVHHGPKAPPEDWEKLYRQFEQRRDGAVAPSDDVLPAETPLDGDKSLMLPGMETSSTLYLQLKGRYILSPVRSGLMVVDQHRAHVRILFDRYMQRVNVANNATQRVLFPEVITLTPAQTLIMEEYLSALEAMGFTLSRLGGDEWSVVSVPSGMEGVNVKAMLLQLLETHGEGAKLVEDQLREHIAMSIAQAAAIPYGRQLNQSEMDVLVGDLLRLPQPNYTPDGKLVIAMIDTEHINRLFS